MKLLGALSHMEPWTPEQEALLVQAYASGGVKAAQLALPQRSRTSLMKRAERLGCYRRQRWTEEEDRKLRWLWDEPLGIDAIAEKLGRTRLTTYWRAQVLELPLGPPQGCEYLYVAARRVGYSTGDELRRVLDWAGVKIRLCRTRRGKHAGRYYVDSFDVDEAVERWLKTETAEAAARRLGISGEALREKLKRAGVAISREQHARVTEEQLEAARRVHCAGDCGRWWYAKPGTSRERCPDCGRRRQNELHRARRLLLATARHSALALQRSSGVAPPTPGNTGVPVRSAGADCVRGVAA